MSRRLIKCFVLIFILSIFVVVLACCNSSNDIPTDSSPIRQVTKPDYSSTFIYDGSLHTINIKESNDYSIVGTTTAIEAGTYYAELKLNDKLNTEWEDGTVSNVIIEWTIEKATFDTSILNFVDKSIVADGKSHGIFVDESLLPYGVSIEYSNNSFDLPGEYDVTISFIYDSGNYNRILPITATLTILKGTIDMSGILFDNHFKYTLGEDLLPITHTFSIIENTLPIGVRYEIISDNFNQCLPGEYMIEVAFYHNNPYFESIPNMFIPLIIEKGDFDIDVKLVDKEVTFDFSSYSLDFNIENFREVKGICITFDNEFYSDAGNYIVTATISNDKVLNYFNDFELKLEGNLVINKRIIAMPIIQYEYDFCGSNVPFNVIDTKYYLVEGDKIANKVGVYHSTIKLVDNKNTIWVSNTIDDIMVRWFVKDTMENKSNIAPYNYLEKIHMQYCNFICDATYIENGCIRPRNKYIE